jgi:alpha-galactosidase
MLQVGYTNTPNQNLTQSRPSRLTPDEQYAQVTLWSLLAAPLIVSCDLERLDAFTLNLLTNPEVIAVDQDPLGKAAVELPAAGRLRVFRKEMEDGSVVVGLFNTHPFRPADRPALPETLKLPAGGRLRDCWRMQELKLKDGRLPVAIPPHGCALLRAFPPAKP